MTAADALAIRQLMLLGARQLELIAAMEWLDSASRYKAIITREQCLEIAADADAFIRESAGVE